mmetsp:Transcript_24079/g.23147  ORF Transcript_24079/g.23147 Transcript_24079/m.23147 type:complete len:426 (+) Transcript_24079:96-1373(+)
MFRNSIRRLVPVKSTGSHLRRKCSTSSSATKNTTPSIEPVPVLPVSTKTIVETGNVEWKRLMFFRLIRIVRVAGLSYALYQAGYSAGLTNYAQNPVEVDKQLVDTVIASTGSKSANTNTLDINNVKRVAGRIVFAAKDLCQNNMEQADNQIIKLKSQIIDTNFKIADLKKIALQKKTENNVTHLLPVVEEVSIISLLALNTKANLEIMEMKIMAEKWAEASQKLNGNWDYFVIDNDAVNAFVTDLCPRKIFVFKGLLNLVSKHGNRAINDDELGMIIGHEISHLILSHNDSQRQLQLVLTSLQLLVLTFLDPVGFFSFFVDLLNYQIVQYISASYSRQHEEEADSLGIQIAAVACFDTKKGSQIFEKLAEIEKSRTSLFSGSNWNLTHPPSDERHIKMLLESDTHNRVQYGCSFYLDALRKIGLY